MPEQRGVCALVAGGGCGRGKGELPLQDAAQSWCLAGQGEGSGVTLAVDVPSPARAVQTNSPPLPWLIGIARSGNAHVHPRLCAQTHGSMECFELPGLCSEPESVPLLSTTQNYIPRINNGTLKSSFFA